MITSEQWTAFGLCVQEKKNKKVAAELMGLTYDKVKALLNDMKVQEPDLFPIESESQNIRQHLSSKERKRYNHDIVSYDARKDGADNIEDEIKEKF